MAAIGEAPGGFRNSGEQPAIEQRLADFDGQHAGEMAVTGAGEAQFLDPLGLLTGARTKIDLGAQGRESSQRFEGRRDPSVGQAVITMLALAFDGDQGSVQQFTEMETGGLRGDIAEKGQFPGGERTAVDQRHQHGCARRLAH